MPRRKSNPILEQLIAKGNPFPPKSSYAKGKKKLQKRRRSRTSFTIPSGDTPNNNQDGSSISNVNHGSNRNNSPDGKSSNSSSSTPTQKQSFIGDKVGLSHDHIIDILSHPLVVKVKMDESDGGVENHVKIVQELKQVAKTHNENVKNVVGEVLDERIVYYISSLLHKKIKASKGQITYDVAKILSHQYFRDNNDNHNHDTSESPRRVSYTDNEFDEEEREEDRGDNHGKVVQRDELTDEEKQQQHNNNNYSKSESTKAKNEEIVDHIAKVKSIHDHMPSLRKMLGLEKTKKDEDKVDHIAKIKSIYDENSLTLHEMLGLKNENKKVMDSATNTNNKQSTYNNKKIGNCSTSFAVLELEKWTEDIMKCGKNADDDDENMKVSAPIKFQTFISIDILKHQEMMNLDTSGTIVGSMSKDSFIDLKVTLDSKSFVNTLVEKVNNTIKTAIKSNSSHGNVPNRRFQVCFLSIDDMKAEPKDQQHDKINIHTFDDVQQNKNGSQSVMSRKRRSINLETAIASSSGLQEQHTYTLGHNSVTSSGTKKARRTSRRNSLASISSVDPNRLSEVSASSISDVFDRTGMNQCNNNMNNYQDLVRAAVENARSQNIESAFNSVERNSLRNSQGNSFGVNTSFMGENSMASAAAVVRLAEMTNQLDAIGTRQLGDLSNNNLNRYSTFSLGQQQQEDYLNLSLQSNPDLRHLLDMNQRLSESAGRFVEPTQQQSELEAAIQYLSRRPSNQASTSMVNLTSLLDPFQDSSATRRRSSYNREVATMESVLSALRRRSSSGNSITAAAEAVRTTDIENIRTTMMQQQSSRPSIAAAAEAIRRTELDAIRGGGSRNSFGTAEGSVNSIAAAAEIVRLSEAENMMRNGGRQSFTLQDDDTWNSIIRRSSASQTNYALAAAAAEIQRLNDLESQNVAYLASIDRNYLCQNQGSEQSQRSRQNRVSFRLNNMNNTNGMNEL